MKSLLKNYLFIIIFILWLLIAVCLIQRYVKTQELSRIVTLALNETQRVQMDHRYELSSNEEYMAEFMQNLIRLMQTHQDVKIEFYGVDYEKGLLDVGVETIIHDPLRQNHTLSLRKTSIIERKEREDEE